MAGYIAPLGFPLFTNQLINYLFEHLVPFNLNAHIIRYIQLAPIHLFNYYTHISSLILLPVIKTWHETFISAYIDSSVNEPTVNTLKGFQLGSFGAKMECLNEELLFYLLEKCVFSKLYVLLIYQRIGADRRFCEVASK